VREEAGWAQPSASSPPRYLNLKSNKRKEEANKTKKQAKQSHRQGWLFAAS